MQRLFDVAISITGAAFFARDDTVRFKKILQMCKKNKHVSNSLANVEFCDEIERFTSEWIQIHIMTTTDSDSAEWMDMYDTTRMIIPSVDRTVYPPDSTVHVRIRIAGLIRGENIRCDVRDQENNILWSTDISTSQM